jgi:hypothetical protein
MKDKSLTDLWFEGIYGSSVPNVRNSILSVTPPIQAPLSMASSCVSGIEPHIPECEHEFQEGRMLLSSPPQKRCTKCHKLFPYDWKKPGPKYYVKGTSMIDQLQRRIQSAVHDYTYANYSQRYSSSDYTGEINEAEIRLTELVSLANDAGVADKISRNVSGYLNINVDLNRRFKLQNKVEGEKYE